MIQKEGLYKRIGIVLGIVGAIALYGCWSYFTGSGMVCWLYQLTGWYCPGCGMGRCVNSMLHGDFYQAFRFNAFWMPMVIPGTLLLIYTAWEFIRGIGEKDYLILRFLKKFGVVLAILASLFGVLRNFIDILAPNVI